LCVCMCAYMHTYVCVCVCVHICVRVYVCMRVYVCINAYMRVCKCVCVCVCACACLHVTCECVLHACMRVGISVSLLYPNLLDLGKLKEIVFYLTYRNATPRCFPVSHPHFSKGLTGKRCAENLDSIRVQWCAHCTKRCSPWDERTSKVCGLFHYQADETPLYRILTTEERLEPKGTDNRLHLVWNTL